MTVKTNRAYKNKGSYEKNHLLALLWIVMITVISTTCERMKVGELSHLAIVTKRTYINPKIKIRRSQNLQM